MAAEKNFENRIKKFLDEQGAWYVKFFANAMTKSGIPDILVCLNGKFIGIEVKQEKGTPSDLQEYHLRQIEKSGGIGILLYPSGFEKFKDEILFFKETSLFLKADKELGYIKFKRGWYE